MLNVPLQERSLVPLKAFFFGQVQLAFLCALIWQVFCGAQRGLIGKMYRDDSRYE